MLHTVQRSVSLTVAGLVLGLAAPMRAANFDDYFLAGSFELPAGGAFDVLGDGRIVALGGDELFTESTVGAGSFQSLGVLPGADFPSFGASFLRVSPGGSQIAVGNNGGVSFGNFEVGVFNLADLSGTWFSAGHFQAEWFDETHLALTAAEFGSPAFVSILDTTSPTPSQPVNPIVVNNIGGASGGVTFDANGNLYTGNGFTIAGPSGTGDVHHIAASDWMDAMGGASPVDFENDATSIIDVLSASSLGFDAEGNLFVGGGDFGGDLNYAAIVSASAVSDALAGLGTIDPTDPAQVLQLDPDRMNDANTYDVNFNHVTGDLYLRSGSTVYRYSVPEPASAILMLTGLSAILARRKGRSYHA